MATTQDGQSKSARIARLRRRAQKAAQECPEEASWIAGILLGIIELLEDEL